MSQYFKTALVLASICAVAAVLLAVVNNVTSEAILNNEKTAKIQARKDVSGSYEIGEETEVPGVDSVLCVCPLLNGGKTEGYVLDLTGKGYGGPLSVTASYRTDGSIIDVKLGNNSETPGVGKRYEKDGYLDMFRDTGNDIPVPSNKKMLSAEDSAVVSGASVSFNGISKALSAGSLYVKSINGGR